MSDRDQVIQSDEQSAAGADPAAETAATPVGDTPPTEPAEVDPALTGDDVAGPQGDPLAAAVPGAGEEIDPESLRAERDQYLALAQRAQADFENFRRRATRETAQAQERGAGRLAKELLPSLDHLELALKAAEAEGGELFKGMRMVQSELIGALGRAGIEPFDPMGVPFDPNEHEAMVQRPVEGAEAGTVVEVYQQGYRLNGAVLRPARVVVAQ